MKILSLRSVLLLSFAFAGLSMVAGCDRPCRTACVRVAQCYKDADISVSGCEHACKGLRDRMAERGEAKRFEAFADCAAQIDVSYARGRPTFAAPQCRQDFARCVSGLPPRVWRDTMGGAL